MLKLDDTHRDARQVLHSFEQAIGADEVWPMFGTSLFWMLHFRLFFAILNRGTGQRDAPRRWRERLERVLLVALVLAKGAIALALNRRRRGGIVFVSSQTNLQKLFDPERGGVRLVDAQIDFLRPHLARYPHVRFEMDSFANRRNMFRSLLRRGLSVVPDSYFDLSARLSRPAPRLPDIELPAQFRGSIDEAALARGKRDVELRAARIEKLVAYFRKIEPRALIAIDENGPPRDYVVAARVLGIPSFAIQHGIIHEYHPSYMYPRWARRVPLADKTFVFGEFYKRLLVDGSVYRDDQVEVVGQQRFSRLRPHLAGIDRSALRRQLGARDGELLVLFASQIVIRSHARELHALFQAAAAEGRRVRLLVKLHPAELEDGFYQGLARQHGFPLERLHVSRSIDLYQAILGCDRVISVISTVLAEAIVLGAQVGLLDASGWPDRYELKSTSLVSLIRSADDVARFIREGNRPPAAERDRFTALHYDGSLTRDVSAAIAGKILEALRAGC